MMLPAAKPASGLGATLAPRPLFFPPARVAKTTASLAVGVAESIEVIGVFPDDEVGGIDVAVVRPLGIPDTSASSTSPVTVLPVTMLNVLPSAGTKPPSISILR